MKYFSLIYQGDIHAATDKKVIPAEAFSELLTAAEIIEKAKADSEILQKEMDEKAKNLHQAAKEEGFEEGLAQLNDHLINFEQETKRIRHEMHKLILPLALKAARRIVGKQLELHPDTIVDIVLQAIKPATHSQRLTIYVNKEDLEALEKEKESIKELFEQLDSLTIQPADDVSRGGCKIVTESGVINAELDQQFRLIEAAFKKYMEKDGSNPA